MQISGYENPWLIVGDNKQGQQLKADSTNQSSGGYNSRVILRKPLDQTRAEQLLTRETPIR